MIEWLRGPRIATVVPQSVSRDVELTRLDPGKLKQYNRQTGPALLTVEPASTGWRSLPLSRK
jgi:hypothetical protein